MKHTLWKTKNRGKLIRHFALNMLNNAKKNFKDTSLKALRKKAGWGNSSLQFVLKQSF